MPEPKRAALYARVSTNRQETENQLIELRRYAEARGWKSTEFVDFGLSGTLSTDKRPHLKELMDAARRRQVDAVVCWDFSRFARSMRQLVEALDSFRSWNVSFISLREGVDTTTANGRLMFGIFASLAEFERELIKERINLGQARRRAQGKPFGRATWKKRPGLVPTEKVCEVWRVYDADKALSVRRIAQMTGVGKSKVSELIQAYKDQDGAKGPINDLNPLSADPI